MMNRKIGFSHLLCSWLFAIFWMTVFGVIAHAATKAPIAPTSTISELAAQLPVISPLFSLPVWRNAKNSVRWRSQDALGESTIFLLLPGRDVTASNARSLITSADGLSTNKLSPAALPAGSPFQFAIASPDPQLLQRLDAARLVGGTPNTKNIVLLRDNKNSLRRDFALQQRYGIAPAESSLLVIDRAGWLRRVEKVSSAAELASLLKTIGDPTPPLEVGQRAPNFALPDMNGTLRRLADLRGKKYLLLTFFPKCFTGTCTKQLESLRDQWPELQAEDIAVWGVSVDPADSDKGQRAFARFLHLPFPLLPDTGRQLSMLYGAAHSPNQSSARMSVLIDKNGIVRWIDKQINPTTHGADVVAKVRSLAFSAP